VTDPVAEDLARLSDAAHAQLIAALQALSTFDLALADRVVRQDAELNALRYQIEDHVTVELGRGPAEPERLRVLIASLSVINDLERIGDHCEGIAKVALMLGSAPAVPLPGQLTALGELVASMLARGTEAFAGRAEDIARNLCAEDDRVDEIYDGLYGELLTAMTSDPTSVVSRTYMLWAIHNLERIADRVTNICERTVYLVTGRVEELNVSNY
jgi:phosphate transport system protein